MNCCGWKKIIQYLIKTISSTYTYLNMKFNSCVCLSHLSLILRSISIFSFVVVTTYSYLNNRQFCFVQISFLCFLIWLYLIRLTNLDNTTAWTDIEHDSDNSPRGRVLCRVRVKQSQVFGLCFFFFVKELINCLRV